MASLVSVANGVQVPLYHDRLVLRAGDLTLDRSGRDAELTRLRRYLHGWGVVAGLVPVLQGDGLVVTAGYGVTPAGDELWLPEALVLDRVAERVVACCGPGGRDCELPDEPIGGDLAAPVVAWLAARVVHTDSALRPGVPDGCAHPVASPLPTRRCEGVGLDLLCALPESHAVPPRTCEELTALVCGTGRTPPDPLPLPPDPDPVADGPGDLLVLGRLVARVGEDLPLHARLDHRDRRVLLPAALLQEHLQQCVCRRLPDEPDEPDEPDGPVDPREPGRPHLSWDAAVVVLRRHGFDVDPGDPRRPRPGDPTRPRPLGPAVLRDRAVLRRLTEAGVDGPLALLDADLAELAERVDVPVARLERAQREVREVAVLLRRR